MKLALGVSFNIKFCSSISRSICTDTKTEGKTLSKLFTFNLNSGIVLTAGITFTKKYSFLYFRNQKHDLKTTCY